MGAPGQVTPLNNYIVLFDGVCNLCAGSVQFIIKRDRKARFQFASLQSDFGQRLMDQVGIDKTALHSVVLVREGQHFRQSDAALEITRRLDFPWPMFYVFKVIPRFLRDVIYKWISQNRYKFFGKKDSCWIPTPALKERFLD